MRFSASFAERVYSNIRDLEGSLNRVLAYAKFINKPITASLAGKRP